MMSIIMSDASNHARWQRPHTMPATIHSANNHARWQRSHPDASNKPITHDANNNTRCQQLTTPATIHDASNNSECQQYLAMPTSIESFPAIVYSFELKSSIRIADWGKHFFVSLTHCDAN